MAKYQQSQQPAGGQRLPLPGLQGPPWLNPLRMAIDGTFGAFWGLLLTSLAIVVLHSDAPAANVVAAAGIAAAIAAYAIVRRIWRN